MGVEDGRSETSIEAWREVKDAGKDTTQQRKVAAALAIRPMTNEELTEFIPEMGENSVAPRVNELVRKECVEREGTRPTKQDNSAKVNHLTEKGERFLAQESDFEKKPTISERKKRVVDVAREVVWGETDPNALEIAVQAHDDAQRRLDPTWEPGDS